MGEVRMMKARLSVQLCFDFARFTTRNIAGVQSLESLWICQVSCVSACGG
jgi:hypothetical protein